MLTEKKRNRVEEALYLIESAFSSKDPDKKRIRELTMEIRKLSGIKRLNYNHKDE